MIKVCVTCGTSYDDPESTLNNCAICEEERQYVPVDGQKWTNIGDLSAHHANKWTQHEAGLLSLKTVPAFAINQRAFLLQTPEGNLLWDCIAHLDEATLRIIEALGGLTGIAISHPHYYTRMQDWAAAFNAPVWLHADDREWIQRDSPAIQLWQGDSLQLTPEVNLIRMGGHFAGGTVLHWHKGDGVLLAGDIIQVTPGADRVSFMWSYPNLLPLPAAEVATMADKAKQLKFDRLYGAFEGQDIRARAGEIVTCSAEKYIACLSGTQPC
ncbi:MBL fold metallo-hydrolase [Pantoea sp. FN060301]|uniref:MBL fold metallo-hydrolase n=1 Tax=Pantoea sp. FN060301 TaxID=3420380 RepID=UPI003D17B170